MIPLPWIRIGVALAIVAVLTAAGAAVRSHWIHVGEARIQAKWDKQQKADADLAVQLAHQAAVDQATRNRNAERTADEDHRREQARLDRLAAAERTAAGLRDAIAKLDADDLSSAAADPRVAAVARRAVTARELLGSCAARYTSLAGTAERIRDQATGLRDFALTVCKAGATAAEEPKKETAQ